MVILHLEISATLTVKADRHYLHQVLLNLLSNAFKYSPEGTPVIISAALCRARRDAPGQVRICVQDFGPGIPPSEIPVLFEKFVRLKRDILGTVRGTGLGLYISRQLVESMGGRIWAESTGVAGEGSRFYVALPQAPSITWQEKTEAPASTKAVR